MIERLIVKYQIQALEGDGIGPVVLESCIRLIKELSKYYSFYLNMKYGPLGGSSWDKFRTFCSDKLLSETKIVGAILMGAASGSNWNDSKREGSPEDKYGLMRLRKELDAYFGIRPKNYYR